MWMMYEQNDLSLHACSSLDMKPQVAGGGRWTWVRKMPASLTRAHCTRCAPSTARTRYSQTHQVSGGAKFEVLGLDLLSAGLLPGPMKRLRRLRRPCEVSCVAEFTDADLMYSPAFRRLAECIVNAALRPKKDRDTGAGRDVPTALGYRVDEQRVHVFRVRTRGSKLVVEGEMESGPLFRVPFRYDCSLSVSHDGHILNVKESTVYWGTPSGHMPLPMLPLQSVTVDLGDR